jgi:hypothetical protein
MEDTFLVYQPYETIFPALSGRREFMANKFTTINFDQKNDEAYRFLLDHMSQKEQQEFFNKYHITFVLSTNTEFLSTYPHLKLVEQTKGLSLYHIDKQ